MDIVVLVVFKRLFLWRRIKLASLLLKAAAPFYIQQYIKKSVKKKPKTKTTHDLKIKNPYDRFTVLFPVCVCVNSQEFPSPLPNSLINL